VKFRGRQLSTLSPRVALSVAGFDPSGGAGVLADVRAFGAVGVYGVAAISLLTHQTTSGLRSVTMRNSRVVCTEVESLLAVQRVAAVKTGALGSAVLVRSLAQLLSRECYLHLPLVVDPVIAATRGTAELGSLATLRAIREKLLPRATVLTANAVEAALLAGTPVSSLRQAHAAARLLLQTGAHCVVVKGGHLRGSESVDIALTSCGEAFELRSPRLALARKVHGTGCAFAAYVCAHLALGRELGAALTQAKLHMQKSLQYAIDVGGAQNVIPVRI
jgi:hydroxymethylpyrimidine kinase/phosphomethylpyrimidine kinase